MSAGGGRERLKFTQWDRAELAEVTTGYFQVVCRCGYQAVARFDGDGPPIAVCTKCGLADELPREWIPALAAPSTEGEPADALAAIREVRDQYATMAANARAADDDPEPYNRRVVALERALARLASTGASGGEGGPMDEAAHAVAGRCIQWIVGASDREKAAIPEDLRKLARRYHASLAPPPEGVASGAGEDALDAMMDAVRYDLSDDGPYAPQMIEVNASKLRDLLARLAHPGASEGPMADLLPCPFCGDEPTVCNDNSYGKCGIGCGCEHAPYVIAPVGRLDLATEKWNQRAHPGASEGERYEGVVGAEIGEDGGVWMFRADDDPAFGEQPATLILRAPSPPDSEPGS